MTQLGTDFIHLGIEYLTTNTCFIYLVTSTITFRHCNVHTYLYRCAMGLVEQNKSNDFIIRAYDLADYSIKLDKRNNKDIHSL